ncbi:MAG: hypothetical protein ACFCD0_10115 [Gemmataceae bacterium]
MIENWATDETVVDGLWQKNAQVVRHSVRPTMSLALGQKQALNEFDVASKKRIASSLHWLVSSIDTGEGLNRVQTFETFSDVQLMQPCRVCLSKV